MAGLITSRWLTNYPRKPIWVFWANTSPRNFWNANSAKKIWQNHDSFVIYPNRPSLPESFSGKFRPAGFSGCQFYLEDVSKSRPFILISPLRPGFFRQVPPHGFFEMAILLRRFGKITPFIPIGLPCLWFFQANSALQVFRDP